MATAAKKFTIKLGKSLLKDFPADASEGTLKHAFLDAINMLPRQDVKKELKNGFSKYFKKLERNMHRHNKTIPKKSQGRGHLGEELVQSEKRGGNEVGEPNTLSAQNTGPSSHFPWLPKVQALLKGCGTVEAIEGMLQVLLEESESDITKCTTKANRAKHLAREIRTILSTCHMTLLKEMLKTSCEQLTHLLSALLSIYVDLSCVYCIKKADKKKKYMNEICGFVSYMMHSSPEGLMEVILQCNCLTKPNIKYLYPAISGFILGQPSPLSHQHYLKIILGLQRLASLCGESKQLELSSHGQKIRPLKGFHGWLRKTCPTVLNTIKLKENSFQKFTIYIISNATDTEIQLLQEVVADDLRNHCAKRRNLLRCLFAETKASADPSLEDSATMDVTEEKLEHVQMASCDSLFFIDTANPDSKKSSKKSKALKKLKKKAKKLKEQENSLKSAKGTKSDDAKATNVCNSEVIEVVPDRFDNEAEVGNQINKADKQTNEIPDSDNETEDKTDVIELSESESDLDSVNLLPDPNVSIQSDKSVRNGEANLSGSVFFSESDIDTSADVQLKSVVHKIIKGSPFRSKSQSGSESSQSQLADRKSGSHTSQSQLTDRKSGSHTPQRKSGSESSQSPLTDRKSRKTLDISGLGAVVDKKGSDNLFECVDLSSDVSDEMDSSESISSDTSLDRKQKNKSVNSPSKTAMEQSLRQKNVNSTPVSKRGVESGIDNVNVSSDDNQMDESSLRNSQRKKSQKDDVCDSPASARKKRKQSDESEVVDESPVKVMGATSSIKKKQRQDSLSDTVTPGKTKKTKSIPDEVDESVKESLQPPSSKKRKSLREKEIETPSKIVKKQSTGEILNTDIPVTPGNKNTSKGAVDKVTPGKRNKKQSTEEDLFQDFVESTVGITPRKRSASANKNSKSDSLSDKDAATPGKQKEKKSTDDYCDDDDDDDDLFEAFVESSKKKQKSNGQSDKETPGKSKTKTSREDKDFEESSEPTDNEEQENKTDVKTSTPHRKGKDVKVNKGNRETSPEKKNVTEKSTPGKRSETLSKANRKDEELYREKSDTAEESDDSEVEIIMDHKQILRSPEEMTQRTSPRKIRNSSNHVDNSSTPSRRKRSDSAMEESDSAKDGKQIMTPKADKKGTTSKLNTTFDKDTPSGKTPSKDALYDKTPDKDTPFRKTRSKETPSSKTPEKDAPSIKTPGKDTPSSKTPSKDTPSSKTPGKDASSSKTPSKDTPSSKTPGKDTPSSKTPGKDTPSSKTPGKDAPSRKTPSKDTPSSKTPGKDTPSSKTPGKDTPSSKTPGKDTPSSKTPGKDAPSSKTPGKDSPSSRTPGKTIQSSITDYLCLSTDSQTDGASNTVTPERRRKNSTSEEKKPPSSKKKGANKKEKDSSPSKKVTKMVNDADIFVIDSESEVAVDKESMIPVDNDMDEISQEEYSQSAFKEKTSENVTGKSVINLDDSDDSIESTSLLNIYTGNKTAGLQNKSIIIPSDESDMEESELPNIGKHLKQAEYTAVKVLDSASYTGTSADNKENMEDVVITDSEVGSADETVIDTFANDLKSPLTKSRNENRSSPRLRTPITSQKASKSPKLSSPRLQSPTQTSGSPMSRSKPDKTLTTEEAQNLVESDKVFPTAKFTYLKSPSPGSKLSLSKSKIVDNNTDDKMERNGVGKKQHDDYNTKESDQDDNAKDERNIRKSPRKGTEGRRTSTGKDDTCSIEPEKVEIDDSKQSEKTPRKSRSTKTDTLDDDKTVDPSLVKHTPSVMEVEEELIDDGKDRKNTRRSLRPRKSVGVKDSKQDETDDGIETATEVVHDKDALPIDGDSRTTRARTSKPTATEEELDKPNPEATSDVGDSDGDAHDDANKGTSRRSLRARKPKVLVEDSDKDGDVSTTTKHTRLRAAKKDVQATAEIRDTRRNARSKDVFDFTSDSEHGESEPETKHTGRRSVAFKNQLESIDEQIERKRVSEKGKARQATPASSKQRPRISSASTSKKVTKKEESKPSRRRRLSGEFNDSTVDSAASGTDSEVSFPQIKKASQKKPSKASDSKVETSPKAKTPSKTTVTRRTSLRRK